MSEIEQAQTTLKILRNISAIAWDFGATYFTDSPMNRFAQKLQSLVNEAEIAVQNAEKDDVHWVDVKLGDKTYKATLDEIGED